MNIKKETRTLNQLLEGLRLKPDSSIVSKVDFDTHPFRGNKFFSFCANVLANEEYRKCFELISDRMPTEIASYRNGNRLDMSRLMSLYFQVQEQISVIESEHKESLEELAISLVRDLYSVPDNIDLKAFLTKNVPLGGNEEGEGDAEGEEDEEEISEERKAYIDIEIQKRIILNSLVHGSAIHIWKSSYFLVRDQLNILDSRLIGLYNQYSSLVSFLLWQYSVSEMESMIENDTAIKQGSNKVEFNDEEDDETDLDNWNNDSDEFEESEEGGIDATLTSYAINFPVLLHELSKSVIDYLITNGIPEDLSVKECEYYYSVADKYSHEIWHYFFGPTLWVSLLETVEKNANELSNIVYGISLLNYDDLSELCSLLIFDKEKAKLKLRALEIID